ncbi:DoxX family protein [Rapidithrix thailandica]|uniref:DoxX family protein n=1 Tax=Rapidithrix thailandica TaxID=413964 RepID=A0AAW9SIU7_9BACT
MELAFIELLKGVLSVKILVSAFLAILFIQSGLDKVFDWGGNLSWLKGHFEKSPLKNLVPLMLGVVTVFELAAGFVSAAGCVVLVSGGEATIALLGAQLSAVSLIMLFFGQRVAKDYVGAATLVSYFILSVLAIVILA